MSVFQVLAAILHLGNVEIKDKDSDSSIIAVRIAHNIAGLSVLHKRSRLLLRV